jgi:hypothetical protein
MPDPSIRPKVDLRPPAGKLAMSVLENAPTALSFLTLPGGDS